MANTKVVEKEDVRWNLSGAGWKAWARFKSVSLVSSSSPSGVTLAMPSSASPAAGKPS